MQSFSIRENEKGNPVIEGYFAKFDEYYEVCPGWKEKISPGAFTKYLQSGGEIKVLWNHNTDIVMGCRSNGTAIFKEDDIGLWGSVEINREDTESMNGLARVKRRDVTKCSFGFDIETKEETIDEDGTWIDDIKTIYPLYEVSPCTFPAYESTEIYARNKEEHKSAVEEFKKRKFERWRDSVEDKLKKMRGKNNA